MAEDKTNINDRLDKLENKNTTLNRLVILIPIITSIISLIIGYFLNSRLEEQKDFSNKIEITHKMLISLRSDQNLAVATNRLLGKLFEEDVNFVNTLNEIFFSLLEEQILDSSKSDDSIVVGNANRIIEFAKRNGGTQGIELAKNLTDSLKNKKEILSKALSLEREAFKLLLDEKITDAINKFVECENLFTGFHSASEIAKYLESIEEPINERTINKIFKTIIEKYSWKAPAREIEKMRKRVNANS